ncbi:hypothetical protein LCGC14_1407200, partial [marine sediment metagenome]
KCPSSGVGDPYWDFGWTNLRHCDQVKFVVGTIEDLMFVEEFLKRFPDLMAEVVLSPMSGPLVQEGPADWRRHVAEFCKTLQVSNPVQQVRMSLQLHRILWGNKQGV